MLKIFSAEGVGGYSYKLVDKLVSLVRESVMTCNGVQWITNRTPIFFKDLVCPFRNRIGHLYGYEVEMK